MADGDRPDRWTAVINPAAGRGRQRTRLPRVVDALAAVDADLAIHVSADLPDALRLARAAFAAGRGVAACGGDGTVAALAGVAADCGGVLAVVPTGSGNDFARHLGIPLHDAGAAVRLLDTGLVERVDLGQAEAADGTTTWFTTVAHAGFDAEVNRWANGIDAIGGTPLYVLGVLRTLAVYRPTPAVVTVDGEKLDADAWLVAVGNTRTYAGGMAITPHAAIDDGILDVCVVGAVSRAVFLRTFPKVFGGTHTEHPAVALRRGAEVAVDLPSSPGAELWASGERVGPLPARVVAVPAALRVVT